MKIEIKRAALVALLALAAGAPALGQPSGPPAGPPPAEPARPNPPQTEQERIRSFAALGKLPDWDRGVWQIDWAHLFSAGGRPTPPDLTPEYAAKFAAYRAGQKAGENVQNANANCLPPGVPGIMQMPYPLEFIFSPGRVTIAIETDSQVRRIWTDGRKLPDDPDQSFNGTSVGHWEGKDLVVDTIAIDPAADISAGVSHSDEERMQERFHQESPDELLITTTITDPKVLTKPFVVTRPYIRHADWQIQEYVCEQNNHDAADAEGRAEFHLGNEDASAPATAPAPAAH
jgi:hypothetical protein